MHQKHAKKGAKSMQKPLFLMLYPLFCAHMSGAEFQYSDLIWGVFCGQMANLGAENGGKKGQLSLLVEAICGDFRWKHDFQ